MADAPTTPTEDLLLELLAARHRLGEPWWTFDARHRRVLEQLEQRGLVEVMSPQVERTVRARFTEAGRDAHLWSGWKPAHQVAVEGIAEDLDDLSALSWWTEQAAAHRLRHATVYAIAREAARVLSKYGRLIDSRTQQVADEHLASLTG